MAYHNKNFSGTDFVRKFVNKRFIPLDIVYEVATMLEYYATWQSNHSAVPEERATLTTTRTLFRNNLKQLSDATTPL